MGVVPRGGRDACGEKVSGPGPSRTESGTRRRNVLCLDPMVVSEVVEVGWRLESLYGHSTYV